MTPLFFVHIPKTAGTSLNKAAAAHYGPQTIEQDYGADSEATTPLVHQHIYGKTPGDAYGLGAVTAAAGTHWLTGHVHAEKYTALFGAQNTLAIVRDPVDRVISEYKHRQQKENETRSFPDFYRDPAETNKQFRMIGQLPWQAFHLVGLQNEYGTFVDLLNASKNLTLEKLTVNKAAQDTTDSVGQQIRSDIRKWNERDCIFVDQVRAYFDKQLHAHQQGHAFCYHDLDFVPDRHIIGWAFYQNTAAPTEIGLYIDDSLAETISAVEYRPELHTLLAPRTGHVGFRFVLSDYTNAASVRVVAAATNQTLLSWQR